MRAEFTSGKILAPLMKFTVPIMIALILQALYGAVDLLVVGQFASPEAVSAVATGSQVMHFDDGHHYRIWQWESRC